MHVKRYYLEPTGLIPNSRFPLLHYRGLDTLQGPSKAGDFHRICNENGWAVQWIYRYGATQRSHYHSTAHECMVVLSGSATIRFGVADVLDTDGKSWTLQEDGGIELEAQEGDVFVIPAGVAHKTFNTQPRADFTLLSPGDGHHISASGHDVAAALSAVELSGFTMCGAYPQGSRFWDSIKGEEQEKVDFEAVWSVAKPAKDPVLGSLPDGVSGSW